MKGIWKKKSEDILRKTKIMTRMGFDRTDWETTGQVLGTKPQLYCQWLTKHTLKFCATNRMLCRFSGNDGTKSEGCPCCPCPSEDSKHQLHCTDPNRIKLLQEDVSNLKRVLKYLGTDETCVSCIGAYIRGR
jgi:hypothetical protein